MAPVSYGFHTNVGAIPTTQKLAGSMPLGLLSHHIDLATCVRVLKITQYVEMNPYPPSGTHIPWPLGSHRVIHIFYENLLHLQIRSSNHCEKEMVWCGGCISHLIAVLIKLSFPICTWAVTEWNVYKATLMIASKTHWLNSKHIGTRYHVIFIKLSPHFWNSNVAIDRGNMHIFSEAFSDPCFQFNLVFVYRETWWSCKVVECIVQKELNFSRRHLVILDCFSNPLKTKHWHWHQHPHF